MIKIKINEKNIKIILTILLPDSATRLIHRITTCAALESKPVVGSSRKSIAGFAASSTAIDNRFFCSKLIPPDNWSPTIVFSSRVNSNIDKTDLTHSVLASFGVSRGNLKAAENSTAS